MIKKILKLIPALIMVTFFLLPAASTKAAVNPSDLIDDSVFENTGTMSAAQIDAFLNSYPSSCLSSNNGFTTPDPKGWSDALGRYDFGGNVTAGQAIYDAGQLYHVNPQVILTTFQKEQTLISGAAGCYQEPNPNWPAASPDTPSNGTTFTCTINGTSQKCTYACTRGGGCMNIALGYGCPYYCAAKDEGFSMQLTLGTWLFRFAEMRAYGILTGYVGHETGDEFFCYTGPMTPGQRQRSASTSTCNGAPGNTMITYDGSYTTVDGVSATIGNGATATLYNFTPYFSGNQNFVNIFQSTFNFGPTTGYLMVSKNTSTVYLVDSSNSTKYPIASLGIMSDYGALGPLQYVSDSFLSSSYPTTGAVLGHIVKGSAVPIYYISASIKLHFPDCASMVDYGYNCGSSPIVLGDAIINKLSSGPDLGQYNKSSSSPTIYYMDNGTKRPVDSWGDLTSLGMPIGWNVLSDATLSQFPTGIRLFGPGSLLKLANNPTVYLVKNVSGLDDSGTLTYSDNQLLTISSFIYPQELGLTLPLRTLGNSDSAYPNYSVTGTIQNKLTCSGSNYIGTLGKLYSIDATTKTALGVNYSSGYIDASGKGGICGALNVASATALKMNVRDQNGTIYQLSSADGQKHPYSTWASYTSAGSPAYTQVSNFFAGTIPTGSAI